MRALTIFLLLPAVAVADVFDDVPAAADYTLVYSLDVPVAGAFHDGPVPWALDASAEVGTFDRVAWYLSLRRPNEAPVHVFVSARAHTPDARALAVPHHGAGFSFQQGLVDLEVVSNLPGVVEGSGRAGHLEFWPGNYATANGAGVPGARDDVFDFGDQPGPGRYGSMQVHDVDAGSTIFAYNRWGDGVASDLGIGDNAVPNEEGVVHPDWTFRANAGEYAERTLQILVRPGPTPPELAMNLEQPPAHLVRQRQPGNVARVPIRGRHHLAPTRIEARATPIDGGVETDWMVIDDAPSGRLFAGELELRAGWYRVEVRALSGAEELGRAEVEPVGVGEVFLTAGQSNSANHGEAPLSPVDARVSAFDGQSWRVARDPQPIATGMGGSPWPPLGDLLAERWGVPIGFVSVGWGGTPVEQWRPNADTGLYLRLLAALDALGPSGARAVLWHQGESDASNGTTTEVYAARLRELITASRLDAGWPVPWGVARVGFLPGLPPELSEAIVVAQDAVIEGDPGVFAGPLTDDLVGPEWRYDGVHFSEAGLREHARRWAEVIELPPCQGFDPDEDCEGPAPDAGLDPDASVEPERDAALAPDVTPEPPRDMGPAPEADAGTPPGADSGARPPSDAAEVGEIGDAGPPDPNERGNADGCRSAPAPLFLPLALLAVRRRRAPRLTERLRSG